MPLPLVKATPPMSSTTRLTELTGLRLPGLGWLKVFQQKEEASESTRLEYATPTSRPNRLPPAVLDAAFVALNVTAPAVADTARREASATTTTAARLILIISLESVVGAMERTGWCDEVLNRRALATWQE
jgi:hypothetical protein